MLLNKTTTYALRVLIFMAAADQPSYSANYLYNKLRISERYLRRLLTDLSKYGFIMSSRGRYGGYVFARNPAGIKISEVIEAVEGPGLLNTCIMGVTDCPMEPACAMHGIWGGLKENMLSALSGTNLTDLGKPGLAGI